MNQDLIGQLIKRLTGTRDRQKKALEATQDELSMLEKLQLDDLKKGPT